MSLSHALLGFLNYAPLSGYDIKKIMDDSVNFFWMAQTSQIYRELRALESKGCICSTVESSVKGPQRRLYSITEKGRLDLEDWLSKGPTDETMRNEFMIWLLFSSLTSKSKLNEQIQNKLHAYKNEYNMLISVQNSIQEYVKKFRKENEEFYWKMVLKRGIYDVEAKIRWAEDILNDIQAKTETD